MNVELIRQILHERLPSAALMKEAADVCGVSLATMYRYKSDPSGMPLGKVVQIANRFGIPLEGTIAWSKYLPLEGERRRHELEKLIADNGGYRYTVTPSYSVNCELAEVTRALWDFDYGGRYQDILENYIECRAKRRDLYLRGAYVSHEIVIGGAYRDFFNGEGRFKGVPEPLRWQQVEALTQSAKLPHIHRRIYLKNTPELPVFSCFSNNMAVVRIDDLVIEFNGNSVVNQLSETFDAFFKNSDLKTKNEVLEFFQNPNA